MWKAHPPCAHGSVSPLFILRPSALFISGTTGSFGFPVALCIPFSALFFLLPISEFSEIQSSAKSAVFSSAFFKRSLHFLVLTETWVSSENPISLTIFSNPSYNWACMCGCLLCFSLPFSFLGYSNFHFPDSGPWQIVTRHC